MTGAGGRNNPTLVEIHNVATWNLCLGLFHKKDYVKELLKSKHISILNLTENELKSDLNCNLLNIPGFVLEDENSTFVKYNRRKDLEMQNRQMVVLDLNGANETRMVNMIDKQWLLLEWQIATRWPQVQILPFLSPGRIVFLSITRIDGYVMAMNRVFT